ncbi:MAG: NAD(P)-binding protein [Dehalococcoidia bacterium]|nr:NAD(P)-binding protein [Dehalococcoidia bacterium]
MRREETTCCIVGGGPAGIVAGLLLARQGVDVLILEKHGDFLRDFWGDTIHPSTLELLHELGWIEEFLRLPHTKMTHVTVEMAGTPITFADFRRLRVRCPYVAFMPQWDFLDFLANKARGYRGFRLAMNAEGTELVQEADRVAGVRARTPEGQQASLAKCRSDSVMAQAPVNLRLETCLNFPPSEAGRPTVCR